VFGEGNPAARRRYADQGLCSRAFSGPAGVNRYLFSGLGQIHDISEEAEEGDLEIERPAD
jgi:hypothetical protein